MESGKVVKVGMRNGIIVLQCSDNLYAAFKPMHPPDPLIGDQLEWSTRGEPGIGRITATRVSDGYLWHVDKAQFDLPAASALALAR